MTGVRLSVSVDDCKLGECDVMADPDHLYEVYNQSLQPIGGGNLSLVLI